MKWCGVYTIGDLLTKYIIEIVNHMLLSVLRINWYAGIGGAIVIYLNVDYIKCETWTISLSRDLSITTAWKR